MSTFQLFIDDDRYSVPTLRILAAADEACARILAEQILVESTHHVGVELYGADHRLFGLGSLAGPRAFAQRGRVASF